ncbi:unnamed protein product [marine sediment metagenome]|uniref:Uncharacterized protein n=1 Tax=marine sediment metagenome TaxID=412755 RepID=X1KY18_9ZZZZ
MKIKAEGMLSCLCCIRATHFKFDPDSEIYYVYCKHSPHGDRPVEHAYDCPHFFSAFVWSITLRNDDTYAP